MGTISIDLVTTYNERYARRAMGTPFYAGVPVTGYSDQIVALAAGGQAALPPVPPGATLQFVLASCDVGTSIVIGWGGIGGDVEIPINLLALVTPPVGATGLYVRNGAGVGSPVVPVRTLIAY